MTSEEIQAEIALGNIGAITLDTSAFGSPDETSLETAQLRRIAQFKGSDIQFILSDVVLLEVTSHLVKQAEDALVKLRRAIRLMDRSWKGSQVEIDKAVNSELVELPPDVITKKRLDTFLDMTGGISIAAKSYAKIEELVERYFSKSPPFGENEAKKYEFPDAIAVLSLESWAAEANKKVLVVSKDGGWIKYCESSDRLIVIKQLSEALSLFHTDANFVCNMLFQKLQRNSYPDLIEKIQSALDTHVENMTFDADASSAHYFDYEIYDASIIDYLIQNYSSSLVPLDMGDNYLVTELSVGIEIEIFCDFQFSTKDWIDKDYVPIGTSSSKTTQSIDLTAVISFDTSDKDNIQIDDIEISGDNHLTINFGEVEPDWGDYEE